jgi:DNA-binding NarL/FixJ family response regulator
MAEPDRYEKLRTTVERIRRHEADLAELRQARKLALLELLAEGATLEQISRQVDRKPQTVTQWLR